MERYRIHPHDAAVYYCTFAVANWLPVFVSEPACRIIGDSLRFCHDQKALGVDSFVIMPTHLHLIVFDREWQSERLPHTLNELRRFTGHKLVESCRQQMPACSVEIFQAAAGSDRAHRFWQATRHPEAITTERFHSQKRDYLHDNPRRKGLVRWPGDWRWSSARWYETNRDADCDVPITPILW